MRDDKPFNRRRFFLEGVRELLGSLSNAAKPLEEAARQFALLGDAVSPAAPPPASPSPPSPPISEPSPDSLEQRRLSLDVWLRPPGALPEDDFYTTCSRCGDCVKACPAQCIKIDSEGCLGNGVPYIEVETMPCVVCTGLDCMRVCPSGALTLVDRLEIDMGTAHFHEETCLRKTGDPCTICIDRCPLGSTAIELLDGKVHVIESGCIGCGVCEHDCPTRPRSIVVIPKSAREGN